MDSEKGYEVIDTHELLKKSYSLYHQGKFRECLQTLKKVHFEVFDRKEWNLENNLLLCENKISHSGNLNNVADKFEKLNEKLTGIPPCPQSLLQELAIGINYCCMLLSGHVTRKLLDACFISGRILTNCILRAAQALDIHNAECPSSSKVVSVHETFNSNTLKTTVKLTEKLLQRTKDADGFELLILSCFILAALWISQHEVDAGLSLLNVVGDSLAVLNNNNNNISFGHLETILVDVSCTKQVFPFCLLPQELGTKPLQAVVIFLTSLCYKFYKHDLDKALSLLDSPVVTECPNTSFFANYLKGLIFYDKDDIDEALHYFKQSSSTATEMVQRNKAPGLSMIGCCLAKKGKHHTAIAKFKEALSSDFSHLDTLFYIAQQYQGIGKDDAEIQCLKYLCEALVVRRSETTNTQPSDFLLQGHFIPFANKLGGRTINLGYATYWLGKRCLMLHRFREASDALLAVLTESRSSPQTQIGTPYLLPSLLLMYRDCAFALLRSGRLKDCVTICDNAIKEAQKEEYKLELWDIHVKSMEKRIRETSESTQQASEFRVCCLQIMLCKADALSNMNQLLQSLECLQTWVFDALDTNFPFLVDNTLGGSRQPKRRKLELSDSRDDVSVIEGAYSLYDEYRGLERKRLLQIKCQAYLIRASVLQSLDKEKESMEELHQSLLCDPDNIAAAYKYSRLLMKLGSKSVAASDWIKFRGLDPSTQIPSQHLKSSSHGDIHALSFYDITETELQDMDNLALKFCN